MREMTVKEFQAKHGFVPRERVYYVFDEKTGKVIGYVSGTRKA